MERNEPIAVVAMAGLFPGALDLNVFWQNIINKLDTTDEVPPDRWIVKPDFIYDPNPAPDKAFSKRACLINNFEFDPTGIDIDAELLAALDPLYHIVLHTGREALGNCSSSSIAKERFGTVLAAIALPTDASSFITREILGASFEEKLFKDKFPNRRRYLSRNQCLAGKVTSLPAAILAKGLGLGGGSYTLDAACASSLYAVKLACDELQSHRADAMLAGGVSRPECLYTQIGFSQLRALSPTGRCAPFDKNADGLVVGEGAGILVLKRLGDALRTGDTIYGIIKGIGLANDIGGNLLSPDTEGQVRAMRKAYDTAGWSPHDVDLIECHGAGTPVGDATEINSLTALWGRTGWSPGQCAIGSIKSMIGHLLTAAGAAGMIKTLLAIKHKTLPPSLKFSQPPPSCPLINSPFRVQVKSEKWRCRNGALPLRAAVSAFGFGGINAHLLFEEWRSDNHADLSDGSDAVSVSSRKPPHLSIATENATNNDIFEPIAIIGMDAAVGRLSSLRAFQEAIFKGDSIISTRPRNRWRGSETTVEKYMNGRAAHGAFMDTLPIGVGEFHIPPNEIPDIIPQHLLILKVAAGAMENAGLPLRKERPDMSVLIGMDFDIEATDFHLRWNLINAVNEWKDKYQIELGTNETSIWLESLRNACGPPLTSSRTLGALGGIIASRIAREFRLGGPSFVVSGEETSGLRALEIGIRSLQKNEVDTALVGAVDLPGDVRNVLATDRIHSFTRRSNIRPFDISADGSLPGEGASALILKRYDHALMDDDRIYAVIKGIGAANGGGIDQPLSANAYKRSLRNSLQSAHVSAESISYIEAHGSGRPVEDNLEAEAINTVFPKRDPSGNDACAVGSVKSNMGHTGAAAGLFSVVKTSLCLYQEIIPPLNNFTEPASTFWQAGTFHIPIKPQYWLRNRQDGPRRACIGAMTSDGNSMHAVLEGVDASADEAKSAARLEQIRLEKKKPLGVSRWGLFIVEGNSKTDLINGLKALVNHVREAALETLQIEALARNWYSSQIPDPSKKYAVSLVADAPDRIEYLATGAINAIMAGKPLKIGASGGISYSPKPLGDLNNPVFIFPGSGNHYLEMGRIYGIHWPEILREMDAETPHLKRQILPQYYMPWRLAWKPGWQTEASKKIISNPLNTIFGQVVFGDLVARTAGLFGIAPAAVIGYSLGESTGLFATGVWPDREEMLKKMLATDLFTAKLAGPCHTVRKAWDIPSDVDISWRVAAVNRTAKEVSTAIKKWPFVKLLIVNTPSECVIGGLKDQLNAVVKELKCEAVFLEGVVSVHCDAAAPVADAYRKLHIFPVNNKKDIRFYSCAMGKSYPLTTNNAADSILKQAIEGFDFTATIRQAHADGIRVFFEMGPHASCTRMISDILKDRPHLAVSASFRGEDEYLSLIKSLGALISERIPVNLARLYGNNACLHFADTSYKKADSEILLVIGGKSPDPQLPLKKVIPSKQAHDKDKAPSASPSLPEPFVSYANTIETMRESIETTSEAHQMFLDFSSELQNAYSEAFNLQTQLLDTIISNGKAEQNLPSNHLPAEDLAPAAPDPVSARPPAYSRDMCMEFAVGSVATVLGPDFSVVDTYKTRVRLPDEPLMLVDRIISIEGKKGSLESGRVVTEHDVTPNAWYLDGGKAPVCISVEAGQADLFLCAFLGIDLAVKGARSYRLLDATVQFHSELPQPGDTIRYEIKIERFVRQGDTYLFFFNFEGFIGNSHLITMTEGCAGFFTSEEVESSGGIILTDEETRGPQKRTLPEAGVLKALFPKEVESYDENALAALRDGNPAECFGTLFAGIKIPDSLKLPEGRMALIDRVLSLDPAGGRFGLGRIRAEADIHPDDWFLTCHFMDDMVMPGTLMYECCAHTLRVFLQRMGWIVDTPDTSYEPVVGIKSVLKCRGPVTPDTRKVVYDVDIKEIGYDPEPYAIADAHMYADDHYIVNFKDMSLKLSGADQKALETFWESKLNTAGLTDGSEPKTIEEPKKAIYDRHQILAFATGKPSEAFGRPYRPFDEDRVIARLPAPPYSFLDRITSVGPEAWVLKPDGWVQSEYDIQPDAWYFRADRSGCVPFAVLLEIALQPCGWLAAYMGSALKSEQDLKFRNLGGTAVLYKNILAETKKLIVRSRLTQVSEAGEMIIEHFDFNVLQNGQLIYDGNTYFGFFAKEALARQVGIRDALETVYLPSEKDLKAGLSFKFSDEAPISPDDINLDPAPLLAMPAKALRMIDIVETYVPDGGPSGLGFIRGTKRVDPDEWFFKAHFYQDPVCPGSLGIESFLQLLKYAALKRWKHLSDSHRFAPLSGRSHSWTYRGQIIPANKRVEVEAVITDIRETPYPVILANGFLKVDNIYIYQMNNFGISLLPIDEN